MKISKHVTLAEVEKSNTAKRLGINNTPTAEHLGNLQKVCTNVFEPIREYFNVPIGISSGYRSEALNEAIGGSKTSQHSKGQALDLDADMHGKVTNKQIFDFIKENLKFDQLIAEFWNKDTSDYAWIHVSYDYDNRNQVLESYRDNNNKTKYKAI